MIYFDLLYVLKLPEKSFTLIFDFDFDDMNLLFCWMTIPSQPYIVISYV